jgi:two-component sensor histidine kinase
MNDALHRILQLPREGLLSGAHGHRSYVRPDGTTMPPDEFPSRLAVKEQRTIERVDLGVIRDDGETIWVEVSAAPMSSTETSCVVATIDITDRKNAEAALQASLREKEALLKEVHHRVKNNLQVINSLLRLEAGRSSHPTTKAVLGDMQRRVQAMALLHDTLYRAGNLAAVELSAYLRQVSTAAFRALAERAGAVRLEFELATVLVELEQAIPCGLVINELVSNALKHAFAGGGEGDIRIELKPVPGTTQVRLCVSDSGAGLPEDFAARRESSLGLQLVSDLAGQLGGELEIGRMPRTTFSITFAPGPARPASTQAKGAPVPPSGARAPGPTPDGEDQ